MRCESMASTCTRNSTFHSCLPLKFITASSLIINTHIQTHTLKCVKAQPQIYTYINTSTYDIAIPNFHKVYRGTGEAELIDGLMNRVFLGSQYLIPDFLYSGLTQHFSAGPSPVSSVDSNLKVVTDVPSAELLRKAGDTQPFSPSQQDCLADRSGHLLNSGF